MSTIHFLNVNQGDCSVIEHESGRTTVIDVCNAKAPQTQPLVDAILSAMARSERGVGGNFQQKKYAVNPISYLRERGINSVFRYVQTHPDMDHMDGIEAFFETFSPLNFWDTNNQEEKTFGVGSQYSERDWRFYKQIRETSTV